MKFSITFNNEDCSGELWEETFDDSTVKNIDDASEFARGYVKGCAACGARVRVLMVTAEAPPRTPRLRLRDVLSSPWED